MSLPETPATADEDSDPSIEIYGSDANASVSEDPEEEEYEEVEVEEEIEEEEGQEVEVKDECEVSGTPVDADKDPEDGSQHIELESEGQERTFRPVSSVAVNPNTVSVEKNDSCRNLTTKKEDFYLKHVTSSSPNSRNIVVTAEDDKHQGLYVDNEQNGSRWQSKSFGETNEPSCDSKTYLCGVKDSGRAKLSSDTGKDVAAGFLQRDCFLEDAYVCTQNSMNQIKQLEMQSGDEMKQMVSRFTSPDMRTRSLSPSAEMNDGNKRPAIICNFFAKGWCIRGNSCRFLHIKDHVTNSGQLAEGDLVSANWKREVQLEEGLGDSAETSRIPDAPVTLATSLVSTSLYSSENCLKETIQDEQEASPSQHPPQDKQKFPLLPKEDLSLMNHALPISRDSSTSRDSLFPENRSMLNASSNYFTTNLSSYPPCAEGLTTIQSQHMYNKYASQVMNHSPKSSLVTHIPTTSMLLSHQISAPSGYSSSFNSSIGATTLDVQKALNSGKEYCAPRSTLFGPEWENSPLFSSSGVPALATRYRTKVSYDWEPSVPFRPSFFITPTSMSSPGDLYDPFHPSVETLNIGDGSLKASYFIQGPPIQASSQVRTYGGEYAAPRDKVADLNDDKSSVSSHNRFFENEPNRSCAPCEKDCLAPETETTVRTHLNSHNGKTRIGDNTFGVQDITKIEKVRTEHDAKHQVEGSGHKKKRVDKAKINNEMNVELQMEGDIQNDLKALKNFRAALVDLVKELLKPSWQEGRLSKDAHNTIVKKSVDKVISTLQPHQIPTTINTVNHYVSSSRFKITKLVDGYVNKYGRS